MRKLIVQMMVSIDGYFEGTRGELDWHVVDSEFNDFAIENLKKIDTLVFGRLTYQLMAGYWPSKDALADDPIVAGFMNRMAKVVFSESLDKVEWSNSRLVKSDPAAEIKRLKKLPGNEIAIFGSSLLTAGLIDQNLIDEYRIMVNPVLLGDGNSLFKGIKIRLKLKLVNTQIFKSGNVLLCYHPIDS